MLVTDASKIRRTRKAKRLSLRQLGTLCKRSQSAISNLENGVTKQVDEDFAVAVATWLGLALEDVFATPTATVMPAGASRARAACGGDVA